MARIVDKTALPATFQKECRRGRRHSVSHLKMSIKVERFVSREFPLLTIWLPMVENRLVEATVAFGNG